MTTATDPMSEAEVASDAIPHQDPYALFDAWFADAHAAEPNDSNAMALATATPDGLPSVRMVLLKGHGPYLDSDTGKSGGFVFYTNSHSRKGVELTANPHAALLFHWKSLRRQIRIEGSLTPVGVAAADAYFASRSHDSQVGAVASDQSAPLASRATFLARYRDVEDEYAGREIARPAHWTGYLLSPDALEFWIDRPHRLHERRRFTRASAISGGGATAGWVSTLLYP